MIQNAETYYVGAYWGDRKESLEECARRAELFLTALPEADPSFSHWFQQRRPSKDALKRPITPNRKALETLIFEGRDRQFEDLGYSVGAWNGESNNTDACAFTISCGNHSGSTPNRCVFDLPTRGPNAERVLTASVLTGLLRTIAVAWQPDWGVAMSRAHRDRIVSHRAPGEPYLAWITYLSHARSLFPPLPEPVRTEPVGDLGTLLILTPERFTVSNPEHVALAARVQELLQSVGLLTPKSLKP